MEKKYVFVRLEAWHDALRGTTRFEKEAEEEFSSDVAAFARAMDEQKLYLPGRTVSGKEVEGYLYLYRTGDTYIGVKAI